MAYYFGIDTSNYTTSVAVYDTDTRAVTQVKKLLTVRPGSVACARVTRFFSIPVSFPN